MNATISDSLSTLIDMINVQFLPMDRSSVDALWLSLSVNWITTQNKSATGCIHIIILRKSVHLANK